MRDADIERLVRDNIGSIITVEKYHLRLKLIEEIGFDRLYQALDLEPLDLDDLIVDYSVRDLGIKFERQIQIVDAYIRRSDKLILTSGELNVLPEHLGKLTHLTHLDLNNNYFDILPLAIFDLTNLVSLNLNWNQINVLPDKFDRFSNLESLSLHGNPILDLSPLQRLPERAQVHFIKECLPRRYWTKISDWKPQWLFDEPDFQVRMKLLQEVGLERVFQDLKIKPLILDDLEFQVPFAEFDEDIFDSEDLYYSEYPSEEIDEYPSDELDLELIGDRKIDAESVDVYYDDYPEEIYADGINEFSSKATLAGAYILGSTHLDLYGRNIKNLTASIGMLSNLTSLNLSNNLLTELPNTIREIPKIESLNLSGNLFHKIPSVVLELPYLKHLDLSNNKIEYIGSIFEKLSHLERLDLSNNPIIDLSPLQELTQLKVRFFGILLPRRYWRKFSDWEPQWLLDEDNVEIRRTLIQQVGYERIAQALEAEEIDRWREYILLKIDIAEKVYDWAGYEIAIEPLLLLKMICPSTNHIHILRVPPEITKAEDAIVWVNHGIHPDRIAVQT